MDGNGTGTGATANSTAAQNANSSTGAGVQTPAAGTPSNNGATSQQTGTFDFNNPEFQKFIQASVDRATNKLGNENKSLREQLDALQKSKLSDDELKDAQLKQRENDVAEREAQIKTEQNRMYALGKIKAAGLDDGTDTALSLIDLVMADDEKGIDIRVESLNTLVKKLVTAEVNKTFAANGRQPGKSNDPNDGKSDKNTAAISVGKRAAAANKASQSILDFYTGGKK